MGNAEELRKLSEECYKILGLPNLLLRAIETKVRT